MGSRRLTIHIGHTDSSVFISNFQDLKYFVFLSNISFCHFSDIDTLILMFMNFQVYFFWVKQISNLFIVNFDKRYFYREFYIFCRLFYLFKNTSNHSWDDTFVLFIVDTRTQHCMSFSRASLTIGHDRTIETF
jgi:hypothetical protein